MNSNTRKKNQKGKTNKLTKQSSSVNSGKYSLVFLAIIIVISFFAFRAMLRNGFVWDDRVFIVGNDLIKSVSFNNIMAIFSNFSNDNYSPITDLINAFLYNIDGANSYMFHIGSLLFHLINVLLVFLFVRKLSAHTEIALIAALFFGMHPMNVESVAWISGGSNLYSCTFFLGSLLFYLDYLQHNKSKFLIFSLIFFVLSVLSKAVVVFLPFVLILIDYYKNRKLNQKLILDKIPFFIVSFIIVVLSVSLKSQFGTIENLKEFSFSQRVVFASYGFITYLLKFVIPYKLSAYYPYPINEGEAIPAIFYLYLLLTIGLIIITIYSKQFTRKIIFGLGFFTILILMVLQIIPLGNSIMADRYIYIPSIGIFYLMGLGIYYLWNKKSKLLGVVIFSILSIFFFIKTSDKSKVWKNGTTLWTNVIQNYKTDALPYYNLGVSLMDEENTDQALYNFNKAIELDPRDAEAYVNRGMILRDNNRTSEALTDFNKALELKPNFAKVYFNRGSLLKKDNRNEEALKDYNVAIKLNPNFIDAIFNRANLYRDIKKYNEALKDYSTVIELNPNYVEAYINRGGLYYVNKLYSEAINDYNKAIEFTPDYALVYYNRGLSYYNLGNKDASCDDLKHSSELGYKPASDAVLQLCN